MSLDPRLRAAPTSALVFLICLLLMLVAPPTRAGWDLAWSSNAAAYGGPGAVEPEEDGAWILAAECAVLLRPSHRPLPARTERRRIPREGRRP